MKTNVASTSIENYHQCILPNKAAQELYVLSVMSLNRLYTGRELAEITDFVPGTISRILGDLRKDDLVVIEGRKICPLSGKSVFAHRKLAKQLVLV